MSNCSLEQLVFHHWHPAILYATFFSPVELHSYNVKTAALLKGTLMAAITNATMREISISYPTPGYSILSVNLAVRNQVNLQAGAAPVPPSSPRGDTTLNG